MTSLKIYTKFQGKLSHWACSGIWFSNPDQSLLE